MPPTPGQPLPSRSRPGWLVLAVSLLLIVHYLLAVSAAWQKSITFDEHMHLTQGVLRWLRPQHPFPAMNGLVAQSLGGLPSVAAGVTLPDTESMAWRELDQFQQATAILYTSGNDPVAMLRRGRAATALLSVACGLLTFLWAREIFGTTGGLLSLTLYVFSPATLANGPLVTADMAAAFLFLASTYTFWRVTHRTSWRALAASGAALGLLLITKTSSVLIAPIFALIFLTRVFAGPGIALRLAGFPSASFESPLRRAAAMAALLAVHGIIACAFLWTFYDFVTLGPNLQEVAGELRTGSSDLSETARSWKLSAVETLAGTALLPHAFLEALRMTFFASESTPAFLAGRYSFEGFRWFFPFAFLVKTPVGILALILMALGGAVWAFVSDRAKTQRGLYQVAPIVFLVAVYGLSAVGMKMNIGVRHILPIYAPLIILCGASARWLSVGSRWTRWAVLALVGSTVGSAAVAYPHYLAYFNLPSGGSARGYRLLVDSSLDWGQDLPALKHWLTGHRRPEEVLYLSYFGTGQPAIYDLEPEWLTCHFDWFPKNLPPLRGGVYCISATMLNSVYTPFFGAWCRSYEDLYQRAVAAVNRVPPAEGDLTARKRFFEEEGAALWEARLQAYRHLRFNRLCAALRRREPDASAGHSILIFRLTDEDVARALDGPAPELAPDPPFVPAVLGQLPAGLFPPAPAPASPERGLGH